MDNLPLPDVGDTIVRIAGLSPAAQVAAVIGIACIAMMWIWTRRPQQQGASNETLNLVIGAMNEHSTVTSRLADQVERLVEQNAVRLDRLEADAAAKARLPVQAMEKA